MKNKTAVEWLAVQLDKIGVTKELIGHLIKEAKEMEKNQLKQFYNHGKWAVIDYGQDEEFKDYHNRIFNKKL